MTALGADTDDPYALLGVSPGVDRATLGVARRRLARKLHPDHPGGDAETMRRINQAYEAVLADLDAASTAAPVPSTTSPSPAAGRPGGGGRVAHDVASFTIEALPAEAFEALLIVTGVLGELLDDDPPYQLDAVLGEPFDCWCRLDLVPDAGASTVAVTLASIDGRPLPELDAVRDAWVRELNLVGRSEP